MTRKGDFSFGSYLNLEMPVIELVSKYMPEGLKAKCEPAAGECYQDTKDLSSNRLGVEIVVLLNFTTCYIQDVFINNSHLINIESILEMMYR